MKYSKDTRLKDMDIADQNELKQILMESGTPMDVINSVIDDRHTIGDLEGKTADYPALGDFVKSKTSFLGLFAKKSQRKKMRGGKKKIRNEEAEKRLNDRRKKRQMELASGKGEMPKTDHVFIDKYRNPRSPPLWRKDTTYDRETIESEWVPKKEERSIISEAAWRRITSPDYIKEIEESCYVKIETDKTGMPIRRMMLYPDQLRMVVSDVMRGDNPNLKSFNKKKK